MTLAARRNVEGYMNLVAWDDHEGTYEVTPPDAPTRRLAVALSQVLNVRSGLSAYSLRSAGWFD